jgi:hypothetical protein
MSATATLVFVAVMGVLRAWLGWRLGDADKGEPYLWIAGICVFLAVQAGTP